MRPRKNGPASGADYGSSGGVPLASDTSEDRLDAIDSIAGRHRRSVRFNTARRTFRILDHVGQQEGVTAKVLARKLGVSLSTCYCLIDILIEEGFVERVAHRKGYRLGPAVGTLIEMPTNKAPVAVVEASDDASHALAIGKILIAAAGPTGLRGYMNDHGLRSFTPRTITDPVRFEAHLAETIERGFATDLEEFSENLCCVAAPVSDGNGKVQGAVYPPRPCTPTGSRKGS